MSTITQSQQDAIAAYVTSHHLPSGLGTAEGACSIAAINLALTNTLTDVVPDCMSVVIGRWIIGVQDAMPDAMRNSPAWKSLLPFAAGTGRDREPQRLAIVLDWMWTRVLPTLQPLADKHGFGDTWTYMLTEKTEDASHAADSAAAAYAADCAASHAADSAAAAAAEAARTAAYPVGAAAYAAAAAAAAAAEAARTAAYPVGAAADPLGAAYAETWNTFDPCEVLQRLIDAQE